MARLPPNLCRVGQATPTGADWKAETTGEHGVCGREAAHNGAGKHALKTQCIASALLLLFLKLVSMSVECRTLDHTHQAQTTAAGGEEEVAGEERHAAALDAIVFLVYGRSPVPSGFYNRKISSLAGESACATNTYHRRQGEVTRPCVFLLAAPFTPANRCLFRVHQISQSRFLFSFFPTVHS